MSEDRTLVNESDNRVSGLTRTTPKRRGTSSGQQCDRAVQTDDWTGSFFPASGGTQTFSDFSSSISPNDALSESSSLAENSSTLGSLLERLAQLFSRMTQSDALTLTTRLKRQNIAGADVSHLSRSTVESIISDVSNLRGALRGALEDEKFTTICTRKDLRALLKLFRDLFRELGTLRVMLNDIILDPSIAPKMREMVFRPEKAEQAAAKSAAATASSWIAPLSKLFGGVAPSAEPARFLSPLGLGRAPSRAIPKAPAAPSASTTTVNIEFTGTGASRAVTESFSHAGGAAGSSAIAAPVPTAARQPSTNVMNIFAGAPRAGPSTDPWVVVRAASRLRARAPGAGESLLRPTSRARDARRVSRNVDAMTLDGDGSGPNGPLLARTLRPRGLSDSSIRSTFVAHADAPPTQLSRPTVFQTLTQRVSAAVAEASASVSPPSSAGAGAGLHRRMGSGQGTLPRVMSPGLARLLPDMAWGMAGEEGEVGDPDTFLGSFHSRQEPAVSWMRGATSRNI
jgi:hypothetical protein